MRGQTVEYYRIHDLLSFSVQGESQSWIKASIHTEYQNFISKMEQDLDLTIIIGDFHPDYVDCIVLDNTFYVKQDYLYCEDSYKRAQWKLELTGLESGHPQVKISGNYFSKYIIPGFIIDPIISYILSESGYSLIHSSAVCNDFGASLFTAQGGAGKTSTALYATERGCQFMGDNFIIVHKGQAIPYLSPLNIFPFNMLPHLEKSLPWQIQFRYFMRKLLSSLTGIQFVTKINPCDVNINSAATASPIRTICILVPHDGFNISRIGLQDLIRRMVLNLKIDFAFFNKYVMQYSFTFPGSSLAAYWKNYEEKLTYNLQNLQNSVLIEVPQKYDLATFEKIWELIK